MLRYHALSLGWRQMDHTPTPADYGHYQATLDRLLTRPYARAALLAGGIVWRIAVHYLGDSVLDVTKGPSDATWLSQYWKPLGGPYLYDDGLSELEMDIICGVYEVPTGDYLYFIK